MGHAKIEEKEQSLPQWDLSDLYKSIEDPQINKDLAGAKDHIHHFHETYENKVKSLSPQELLQAIRAYENIDVLITRPSVYAFLVFACNMQKAENVVFYQTIKERVNGLTASLLFFTLELNEIAEERLKTFCDENKDLAYYRPWLRDVRSFKPYQLPKDQEKLLHELRIASQDNWVRLHEETFSGMQFPYAKGNAKTAAEILNLMTSPQEEERKAASIALGKGLKENAPLFALITNTLAKQKDVEDSWRGFSAPIQSRNVANLVEDEVVEALLDSVRQAYPDLTHRYYKLKAKWMGKEKLAMWDRNAPLPDRNPQHYSWGQAKDIVLAAYHDFSPEMAAIGQKFFTHNWIDAKVVDGKDTGAFSASTVPECHPYILTNFFGKTRCVATLAHELGHGIHQYLSQSQGALMSDTPLTIAETASVFGEMLTFKKLLAMAKTPGEKKVILAGKVEDMLNTVVRQVAMCHFEKEVHAARKKQELSPAEIGEIWMKTQSESLGPSVDLDPHYYAYYWAYIPHFIHTPFYVYAYAFGDCLVNSLYSLYENGFPNFQTTYLEMLRLGGRLRYDELLAMFKLNPRHRSFWDGGLSIISQLIDELERLP